MTDKELLELAAKAVGINLLWDGSKKDWMPCIYNEYGSYTAWDALNNSKDAFYLMVKLRLDIAHYIQSSEVAAWQWVNFEKRHVCIERLDNVCDEEQFTRRVIVRCAAEIGKNV